MPFGTSCYSGNNAYPFTPLPCFSTVEWLETVPISTLNCPEMESISTSLMISQNISTFQFRKKESFTIWSMRVRLLSVARLRG